VVAGDAEHPLQSYGQVDRLCSWCLLIDRSWTLPRTLNGVTPPRIRSATAGSGRLVDLAMQLERAQQLDRMPPGW
jgi:hypothetical protein